MNNAQDIPDRLHQIIDMMTIQFSITCNEVRLFSRDVNKDLSLKAKVRTKDHNFVNQVPRSKAKDDIHAYW